MEQRSEECGSLMEEEEGMEGRVEEGGRVLERETEREVWVRKGPLAEEYGGKKGRRERGRKGGREREKIQ